MELVEQMLIDETLAHRLTEAMYRKDVYEEMARKAVQAGESVTGIEEKLVKAMITLDEVKREVTESLPEHLRKEDYTWSYRGYPMDKNTIAIYK